MKKSKIALMSFLTVAGTTIARAEAATFDSSAFQTTLTNGVSAAATVAIGVAGLSAAVMAWKKIRKYFNQAG